MMRIEKSQCSACAYSPFTIHQGRERERVRKNTIWKMNLKLITKLNVWMKQIKWKKLRSIVGISPVSFSAICFGTQACFVHVYTKLYSVVNYLRWQKKNAFWTTTENMQKYDAMPKRIQFRSSTPHYQAYGNWKIENIDAPNSKRNLFGMTILLLSQSCYAYVLSANWIK